MRIRRGFTIVELVVVVLILGILAAVAVPQFLTANRRARENAGRQSLRVFRGAIERWQAENGEFPTGLLELSQFQKGFRGEEMPQCPVGNGSPGALAVVSDGLPLAGTGNTNTTGQPMWKYDSTTGEIIINYHAQSLTGEFYDEW